MQNALIEKYLKFKHRAYLSYASAFYKIYPDSEDTIWNNEAEFETIVGRIFDIYLKKYYCRDKEELAVLNTNNYNEDEFKLALSLAVIADAYQDKYNDLKVTKKEGLFFLTIIVYVITNVDKEVNVISDSISLNSILNVIRKYFKYINQERIMDKNPFIMEILGNKIKDNTRLEKKFFQSIESKEAYHLFKPYSDKVYFAKFEYNNDLLDKYRAVDVEKVFTKYKMDEEFYEISFELILVTILKEYTIGDIVHSIILPIKSSFLKDDKKVSLLEKVFNNAFIKNKIIFSALYNDYVKNKDVFLSLSNRGFKICSYLGNNEILLENTELDSTFDIYASERFIEKNPQFKDNDKIIVVKQAMYITEQELLKKCWED